MNLINANFEGNLTVTTPGVLLKNSTFSGTTSITRNGTSGSFHCDGGNTFAGALTLDNAGTSGRVRMANTTPDTYLGNVTFNSTNGQDVQIAYTGNNIFEGNITINSNKVVFNTSSGKVTFAGGNVQTLHGSYNFPFKKLAINKTGGFVTSNATFSVDDTLFFLKGTFLTKSTNELTLKLGAKVVGASDSSYVEGPVKKIGNTGFVFPTGTNNSYRPIEISAPSTTTSEFIAEFKEDSLSVNNNTKDTTLARLLLKQYWNLYRTSGTSQVYVTLGWNSHSSLVDTLITVASWNGSQWKDLSNGIITGNYGSGSIKSGSTASYYNQFIIGYRSNHTLSVLIDCNNVTTATTLQSCLQHSSIITITDNIILDGNGIDFPLEIGVGVTLQGTTEWWKSGCPLITSTHTFSYFDANCDCGNPPWAGCDLLNNTCEPQALYLFSLNPGATIKNLRIRGASCSFQDFNNEDQLCGGIYILNDQNISPVTIKNCELSCFSYAAITKSDQSYTLNVENCYIHNIKGRAEKVGIGYGMWLKGLPTDVTTVNLENNFYDDCKTAIDGQGDPVEWRINKCTFSQFFTSEDINMHNNNNYKGGTCPCGLPSSCNWTSGLLPCDESHFAYSHLPVGCNYYGSVWSSGGSCTAKLFNTNTPCTTNGIQFLSTPLNSGFNNALYNLNSGEIPFYDVGGGIIEVKNSIFHKAWPKWTSNSNINLCYPLLETSYGGASTNYIEIDNNTFATEQMPPNYFEPFQHNGGYARISDHYIESCVWQDDDNHIKFEDNSFDYKLGVPVSSGSQPWEFDFKLINNSNVDLDETLTLSNSPSNSHIQYIEAGETVKVDHVNSISGTNLTYLIRPNQSENGVTSPAAAEVLSNENYFYDSEIITNGTSTRTPLPNYNNAGLYGIDILTFDANASGTAPNEEYDFKTSAWQYVPLIVKDPDPSNKFLTFNIKDSYRSIGATGIHKRVYLNDELIFTEDIGEGMEGWEYVRIDFANHIIGTSNSILSALHTNGDDNVLSFSIYIEDDNVSTNLVRGLSVWIDDIYIPLTGDPKGSNIIKDGGAEFVSNDLLCSLPSGGCYWYTETAYVGTTCTTDYFAAISPAERKSGTKALYLGLPPYDNNICPFYPAASGGSRAISISTLIDGNNILDCSNYLNPTPLENIDITSSLAPFQDETVRIAENLIIAFGETLSFEGCDVIVESSGTPKSITIQSGGTLNLQNFNGRSTHIFACDNTMWQGIIVEPGGTITTSGTPGSPTGCVIEDAVTAILGIGNNSSTGAPNISIAQTTFNKNLVSLDLSDDNFSSSYIYQSCFKLDGQYLYKDPHPGEYPEKHVSLLNVDDLSFDSGGGMRIEFADVNIGIMAVSSSFSVDHGHFHDLVNYNLIPAQKGIGISAVGLLSTPNSILVEGTLFERIHSGIEVRGNYNTSVLDNYYFRDIENCAILINNGNYLNDILIENNPFRRSNIGINISGSNLNLVSILDNEFVNTDFIETSTSSFHNTAMTIQMPVTTARLNTEVNISNNTITDCRIGIHARNIPGISIGSDLNSGTPNTISFNQNVFDDFHYGIWLENCGRAKVQANEISKLNNVVPSSNFTVEGIFYALGARGLINWNVLNQLPVPIHIRDDCSDTELHCNDINNDTEPGLGVLLTNAVLPNQGSSAIPWNNRWFGYNNTTLLGVNTDAPGTQFFWFYNTGSTAFNPNADPNAAINQPTSATGITCTIEAAPGDPDRDLRYSAIVEDSLLFVDYVNEFTYKTKQYLFEKINADTSLLIQNTSKDSIFNEFYTSYKVSNLGLFARVDSLIEAKDLDAAYTLNYSITDTNQIESNQKAVNTILITKALLDSALNVTDSTTLREIAIQDPIMGGKAVIIARAILFEEIHDILPALRMSAQTTILPFSETKISSFAIVPNPANDKCEIHFVNMEHDFILELRSSVGQLIYNIKLPAKTSSIEIELTKFNAGFYLVSINDRVGIFDQKKLVIAK